MNNKRVISVPILLALLTVAIGAQSPAPTQIGDHQLGETLDQWIATSHYLDDMSTVCEKHKGDKRPWYVKATDKSNCERLKNVRDGKLTRDADDPRLGKIFTGGDDRTFTWKFMNPDGKLAEVDIDVPGITPNNASSADLKPPDVQLEISYLTERYGAPAKTETVAYENGYGAKWDCVQAAWVLPDGAAIIAHEFVLSSRRHLTIMFASKTYLDAVKSQTAVPNPYGPKP
jgi:hypothetical protein